MKRPLPFLAFFAASICIVTGTPLSAFGQSRRAVIFDIDDTLVSTNPRTAEILREVGTEMLIDPLRTLELGQVHYFCSKTLQNVGIENWDTIERVCGNPEKGTLEESPWGYRFFKAPGYLRYDHLIPGAVKFVLRAQKELQAHIVYLTGRSTKFRREETWAQLKYMGFPTESYADDPQSAQLITKEADLSDAEYKQDALIKIQSKYLVVAVFDDSKSNVQMFRDNLNEDVPVVHLVNNVLEKDPSTETIEYITNYYFNVAVDHGGQKQLFSNEPQLTEILKRAGNVRN